MRVGRGEFLLGDCLDRMSEIPNGSVDMILCDLPYGTTQNKWDAVIPFEPLWAQYWRVAKSNAAIVLTAQTPFDKLLGASQIAHLKYEWIWQKTKSTGHLNAKKQPMKSHENILVFYRKQCAYNPKMFKGKLHGSGGGKIDTSSNYGAQKEGKRKYQSDMYYPRSIIDFQHETKPQHPTQKPVDLFAYLINTYTDPGAVVLDNCAGSGTTAIAAERTGRNWICIERDPTYFMQAVMRVSREVAGQ